MGTATPWKEKAVALRDADQLDQSLSVVEQHLKSEPNDPAGWHFKGGLLLMMRRLTQSITCFDKVLTLDKSTNALMGKGICLKELNRHKEALVCFQAEAVRDPHNPETYFNLGLCLFKLGRLDEALEHHEKVISLVDNHSHAWFQKITIELLIPAPPDVSIASMRKYLQIADPSEQGNIAYVRTCLEAIEG